MKYAADVGSGALLYIPSFIKSGSSIQKLIKAILKTHLISLFLFLAYLCDHHAAYVSVKPPLLTVECPNQIVMKLSLSQRSTS